MNVAMILAEAVSDASFINNLISLVLNKGIVLYEYSHPFFAQKNVLELKKLNEELKDNNIAVTNVVLERKPYIVATKTNLMPLVKSANPKAFKNLLRSVED